MASKTSRAQRNAVGVVRVSRVNGRDAKRDRYHTTDNQTDDVAGLARKYGLRLRETLTDENESGGTMDRPGLNEAIAMVIRGEADTIIVAKLDRFARTVQGALDTLALIEEHGGSLICGDLDIDTSTAAGRLILTQLAAVGEFERGRRREDFARATTNATMAGVFVGVPPTGYVRNSKRKLAKDPARAALVTGVFDRRANGLSWTAIREWWHGETGEWKRVGFFSTMVRNRTYLGELTYCGVTSPVAHPALVSAAVWQAVQATLTTQQRKPRNPDTAALLTGTIRCASCGRRMTVSESGRGIVTYRCQKGNLSGQSCPHPSTIAVSKVDDYVAAEFLAWAGGAEMVTTGDDDDAFRAADAAVEAAEQALADYMQAFASVVGVERAQANAGQLMDAIADATRERDGLYARRKLAGIRFRVADEWADYTPMQRRDVLAAALDSVVVHPTSATPSGRRTRWAVADRVSISWRAD